MKNYLIIGSSSGVGRALAIELSRKGNYVILAARRKERLWELQKELEHGSLVIGVDVRQEQQMQEMFDRIKQEGIKLDGMIYSTGICAVQPLKSIQLQDLKDMFEVNTFGYLEACRLFSKPAYSNKGASVVGVSSYASVTREAGMAAYSMTKESMNVQSQVFAKEFVKRRIRINTVMPATIRSKMACDSNEWTEEQLSGIAEKQPYGVIPIENVVGTIEFLLSDIAEYITGETIAISAGYHG